jgi:Amt family ammonium transporter
MQTAAAATAGKTWTIWNQLMIQLTGIGATIVFSVAGTIVICWVVEKTVGFRIPSESEYAGLDRSIHGEQGYGYMQEY